MKPETRSTATAGAIRQELMYTRTISVGRVSKVFSNGWVEVDPQIQMVARDLDGVESPHSLPALSRVPTGFFKAGGFVVTLPVAVGDEGIILFSDRGLSLWKETGKKAPPRETEFHRLNGAIFLPMPTSKPGAVQNYDASSLYVGAEDQQSYLRMAPGGIATLFAAAGLTLDSPLTRITGDLDVQGNLVVALLTQLIGALQTSATVTSAGVHFAPDFVRT